MNALTIRLRRSLDLTMKDTILRINNLGGKDRQSVIDEFREWLDASNSSGKHPHVLYINQINSPDKSTY